MFAAAVTRWSIAYTYDFAEDAGQCSATNIEVTVRAQIIRPRWRPSADSSPSLREWWRDYDFHLKTHEDGHRAVAIRGGVEVYEMMAESTAESCGELDSEIRAQYGELMAVIRNRQSAYDDYDQHR